ncbi:DUF3788 domain-containing protein [Eubacteriales bacterium OttesenSCG-928-M02]|nr:DUF3788 domain-containing protein [Eubacteriales bacterium OttesenSCG-928-M02]
MVAAILQSTASLWDALIQHVSTMDEAAATQWKYYGRAWDWCLVLSSKKNLFSLTP